MSREVVFVIQREGRGHLSQAIAMQSITFNLGLKIARVYVGRSSQRQLPDYFNDAFKGLIQEFASPNLIPDVKGKGIKIGKSLWSGFLNLPRYIITSIRLSNEINGLKPELVINFYEPLLGLSQFFKKIDAPIISIAHQFFSIHSKFKLPKTPRIQKYGLKVLSLIVGHKSEKKLALSFYPFENCTKRNITVVPPLLRPEIERLEAANEDYYLIYILNSGYAHDLIEWHTENPTIKIEIFWDDISFPNPYQPFKNLSFHHLNGELFLNKMARCKALITTAGFESVSEALYLGKRVGVVPVKGHYEQKLNSFDALLTNVCVRNDELDLNILIPKILELDQRKFNKHWIQSGNKHISNEIGKLLNK